MDGRACAKESSELCKERAARKLGRLARRDRLVAPAAPVSPPGTELAALTGTRADARPSATAPRAFRAALARTGGLADSAAWSGACTVREARGRFAGCGAVGAGAARARLRLAGCGCDLLAAGTCGDVDSVRMDRFAFLAGVRAAAAFSAR